MSTITQTVTPYTAVPSINSPSTFESDVDTFLSEINSRVNEANIQASQMNTVAGEVNDNATIASDAVASASASASSAVASANNKGNWSALTGALNIPASVNHNGGVWVLNVNLADVTTSEPTAINTDWTQVDGIASLVEDTTPQLGGDLDMNGHKFSGAITEEVSVCTLTLDATNGTVQTYTATADFTFTDGLADGQFLTLILTNGGFTPTYPTITWWGDAEPTLGTTDKIFFEKIGSVLYGTHVGTIA